MDTINEGPSTIMHLVFGGKVKEKSEPATLLGDTLLFYKVVMCRSCGKIQVTTGEEMFRCRECNKSMKYRKKGFWNVRLKHFATFEEALMAAKKWAMEEEFGGEKSYLRRDDGIL